MILVTARLGQSLILKSDHVRNHLFFISTESSVNHQVGWVEPFFHYLMERFLSVPCLLCEKRDGQFFAFCSAVPLKRCPTAESLKLLQVEDRFGLRESSNISDGKEDPAQQLPCSHSAVTPGKTSVSEGSFPCFLLILCGHKIWK